MNHINFRNIVAVTAACMLSVVATAQGIHLMPNSRVIINGPANLVLNNAGFTNDGNFVAGASKVTFTGTIAPTTAVIGGNVVSTFFNVAINKTGAIRLNKDVFVTGAINMLSGNLQLNTHTVDLGTTGHVEGESNQSRITGEGATPGGSVLASIATLVGGTVYIPGNIGLQILSVNNTGTLTIERKHVPDFLPDGGQSIARSFRLIGNKVTNPITFQLHFLYLDAELNGNDENGLVYWTPSDISNVFLNIGRDGNSATSNFVTKNNLTTLGYYTLGSQSGASFTRSANAGTANQTVTSFSKSSARIYPNPASNEFTIELISKKQQDMVIGLYDEAGHFVQQKQINCIAGINHVAWNLAKNTAGTYYLSFSDKEVGTIKIVKE